MRAEKQQIALECIANGRYKFDGDKIYGRSGKEVFTRPLANKYIQCHVFNGKRYGRGKHAIIYKHVLIYLANYGQYDPSLVIDHIDGDNTNNHPDNLQAITASANKLKAPCDRHSIVYKCIRAAEIAQISDLMQLGLSQAAVANKLGLNRLSVRRIMHKMANGEPLKYAA